MMGEACTLVLFIHFSVSFVYLFVSHGSACRLIHSTVYMHAVVSQSQVLYIVWMLRKGLDEEKATEWCSAGCAMPMAQPKLSAEMEERTNLLSEELTVEKT